jgi:hypothetical protein
MLFSTTLLYDSASQVSFHNVLQPKYSTQLRVSRVTSQANLILLDLIQWFLKLPSIKNLLACSRVSLE